MPEPTVLIQIYSTYSPDVFRKEFPEITIEHEEQSGFDAGGTAVMVLIATGWTLHNIVQPFTQAFMQEAGKDCWKYVKQFVEGKRQKLQQAVTIVLDNDLQISIRVPRADSISCLQELTKDWDTIESRISEKGHYLIDYDPEKRRWQADQWPSKFPYFMKKSPS